jgi:magnesium transporter
LFIVFFRKRVREVFLALIKVFQARLIIAGLAGSSIPIIMKRWGIDPAQSSSITLTTVTDVMGFLAFLGLAVFFQRFLI